jgi:hypothetical protein
MTAESLRMIREVCECLKASLPIDFNDESIFRVHVSETGHELGHLLIKNPGALTWNFESLLDKFHPPRLSVEEEYKNYERQYLHQCTPLACDMQSRVHKNDPMSPTVTLERILSCKTGNEAIELANHPDMWGSQKYEILSLDTPLSFYYGISRIMFQQHEAKLDGDRIENWLRACMG